MALGLDLSASRAKLARANVHLEAIEREVPAAIDERNPYTATIGQIDQNGRCYGILQPNAHVETGLAAIAGDFFHNLRSALDYIVTAIADASKVPLTTSHQFPIFTNEPSYKDKVGTKPPGKGNLKGLTHGFTLFREMQPFQRVQAGGNPHADPLFHINRMSNADKHRELIAPIFQPVGGDATFEPTGGRIIDQFEIAPPEVLPDGDVRFVRLRFAKPYPTQVKITAGLHVQAAFAATPVYGYKTGHAVGVDVLPAIRDHVAMVINLFEKI